MLSWTGDADGLLPFRVHASSESPIRPLPPSSLKSVTGGFPDPISNDNFLIGAFSTSERFKC